MKAESRRSQVRKAEKTLSALLRTPKSRAGLIAAVSGKSITRHFVYGWLTEQLRSGTVSQLKSTQPVTFQITTLVIVERPTVGTYPTWLEPRLLPDAAGRRVFLDGKAITTTTTTR